jgi:hypothetical protein
VNSPIAVAPARLPVKRILLEAFARPWRHRAQLIRSTWVPLLAFIANMFLWRLVEWQSPYQAFVSISFWIPTLVTFLATAWLAVSVHRFVLMEQADATVPPRSFLAARVWIFFAAIVVSGSAYFAVGYVVMRILMQILFASVDLSWSAPEETMRWFRGIYWLSLALPWFLFGRLSLIFPMIALDRAPSPAAAWRISAANTWRITLIAGALPMGLQKCFELLFREEATQPELALLGVLGSLVVVIQVVALSLSYRELAVPLTPPAPLPTDPPA